jgi:hypothetical protein
MLHLDYAKEFTTIAATNLITCFGVAENGSKPIFERRREFRHPLIRQRIPNE